MPLQVFDGSGMVPIEVDAEPILVSIGIDKSLTTFRRGASVCTTNIVRNNRPELLRCSLSRFSL